MKLTFNHHNGDKPIQWLKLNPPQVLALGFLGLIVLGTLLLMLPGATDDRHRLSLIDALFEATSAVCVTGLVVVDTQTTFTVFGQIVLLVLIQTGGLGFMTFGIFIALLLGKNIGLKQRLMIRESLNQMSFAGLVRLVKFVVGFTLLFEAMGALILGIRWAEDFGWPRSLYYGLFHSISAFNNAGFDIMGDYRSLTGYTGDAAVILTISFLLIVGGVGFTVVLDVLKKRSLRNLSLHTKIVLLITLLLNGFGTVSVLILEFHNSATLGSLSFPDQLLAAWFHGVVPRTAGFNSLDTSQLTPGTQLLTMLLMFIGGGTGGTAGGIKVTTFALLVLAVWSVIIGREEVNVMQRRLPTDLVFKALSITMGSTALILFVVFVLSLTENAVLNVILFEVVSAFGTVGLSMGLTPELSPLGKWMIALMMFVGRVGPLTLAFALAKRNNKAHYRYAEEKILIG